MNANLEWKWAPLRRAWLLIDPTGQREPIEILDANGSPEEGPSDFALIKMQELFSK